MFRSTDNKQYDQACIDVQGQGGKFVMTQSEYMPSSMHNVGGGYEYQGEYERFSNGINLSGSFKSVDISGHFVGNQGGTTGPICIDAEVETFEFYNSQFIENQANAHSGSGIAAVMYFNNKYKTPTSKRQAKDNYFFG